VINPTNNNKCACQYSHQTLISNDSEFVKPLAAKIKKINDNFEILLKRPLYDSERISFSIDVSNLQSEIAEACRLIESAGFRALGIELELLEIGNQRKHLININKFKLN
jgi:hypothetical protein